MLLNVEWDEVKATKNLKKHGVSFYEAASVFSDENAITIDDPDHSTQEDRYVDIGLSEKGRLLVVVYTERKSNIRIISAREATPIEIKEYENIK